MATCNRLQSYRGEDVLLLFQLCCSTTTSEYPDVTGWNTCFHLKRDSGDSSFVVSKSGTIVCSTGGKISVSLASSDTVAIASGAYYHDFWRVDIGSLGVLSEGPYQVHWSLLYP